MSHRTVIFDKVTQALADPEVQSTMTTEQCAKVALITAAGESCCSDDDFRYLARRQTKAFCTED